MQLSCISKGTRHMLQDIMLHTRSLRIKYKHECTYMCEKTQSQMFDRVLKRDLNSIT